MRGALACVARARRNERVHLKNTKSEGALGNEDSLHRLFLLHSVFFKFFSVSGATYYGTYCVLGIANTHVARIGGNIGTYQLTLRPCGVLGWPWLRRRVCLVLWPSYLNETRKINEVEVLWFVERVSRFQICH